MTENLPETTTKHKVLERELALITDPRHKEAALEVAAMHKTFGEILPARARENIKPFILSAVRYIRRHLKGEVFTKESFADAVFDAALFGLPIDGRLAYALPYASKDLKDGAKNLVFVPDYKGIVAVAKDRGLVRDVRAYVVRAGDDFQLPGEDSESEGVKWRFRPRLKDGIKGRGEVIGALCILEFPDGRRHPEFMTEDEIKIVRQSAQTQKVWNAQPDEMRKKSVIRRAFKMHQDDPQVNSLMEADDRQYDEGVIEVTKPRVREMTLPSENGSTGSARRRSNESCLPSSLPSTQKVIEPLEKLAARGREVAAVARDKLDLVSETAEDAERVGLKRSFEELYSQAEAVGINPTKQFGVTDEAGDTMPTKDLADLVQIMSETVGEVTA